jgi:YD repeat-containing protein
MLNSLGHQTKYEYDARKRLIKTIHPTTGVVDIEQYKYDNANNLVAYIDANGKETQREYDSRNRLVKQTDPLNQSVSYTYDSAS